MFQYFNNISIAENAWQNTLCEDEGCPGEDANCNGHGTCLKMECKCYPGWKGDDCNTPQCPEDCNGMIKSMIFTDLANNEIRG